MTGYRVAMTPDLDKMVREPGVGAEWRCTANSEQTDLEVRQQEGTTVSQRWSDDSSQCCEKVEDGTQARLENSVITVAPNCDDVDR